MLLDHCAVLLLMFSCFVYLGFFVVCVFGFVCMGFLLVCFGVFGIVVGLGWVFLMLQR